MKKIILIISDNKTRQVYHKTLMSKGIEVIPTSDLSTAMMLLNFEKYNLVILDADYNLIETEIFLRLRLQHPHLSKTKFIILSQNIDFNPEIFSTDILIHTSKLSLTSILTKLEKLV